MLNVQQVRLRFISARLLTSVPSISKGLRKGASTVPLFSKALAGGYPFRCCAQINPQRIKDTPAVNLCSRLVVSERTGMSVVLVSSDVFVQQKLASGSVHGCTLPDRLFSKGLRKGCFRTAMDGSSSTQKRVRLQTRSPRMYKEVHS